MNIRSGGGKVNAACRCVLPFSRAKTRGAAIGNSNVRLGREQLQGPGRYGIFLLVKIDPRQTSPSEGFLAGQVSTSRS